MNSNIFTTKYVLYFLVQYSNNNFLFMMCMLYLLLISKKNTFARWTLKRSSITCADK